MSLRLLDSLREAARETPASELPALRAALAEADSIALARIMTPTKVEAPEVAAANVSIVEAARRIGMSRDWLYRNAGRLPFAVRIGRRLLFDAQGLERWNRSRAGR